MSFGLLTTKWRIFRRESFYDLSKTRDMVQAAARLHNFVIDFHIASGNISYQQEEIDPLHDSSLGLGYHPTVDHEAPSVVNPTTAGSSQRQVYITQEIAALGLQRPQRNIDRNSARTTSAV